jgi:hypothetical protein
VKVCPEAPIAANRINVADATFQRLGLPIFRSPFAVFMMSTVGLYHVGALLCMWTNGSIGAGLTVFLLAGGHRCIRFRFGFRGRKLSSFARLDSRGRLSLHDRLGTSEAKASFTLGTLFAALEALRHPKSGKWILSSLRGSLIFELRTHGLRPFGRLRAGYGLHSCAASRLYSGADDYFVGG